MSLELLIAFVFGVVVGTAIGAVQRTRWHRERRIIDHDGYRQRCGFVSVHECRCVLDRYHVEYHSCPHGAVWGHELRRRAGPPKAE